MRKRIVAGNWKMNKTLDEARTLSQGIAAGSVQAGVQVILAPPFPFILPVAEAAKSNPAVAVAAQNCSNRDKGAFTGEVSAAMIRSCGAEYVIIGHSERRLFFREDSTELRQKINMALENDLVPIYCVGEMLEERQEGRAFDVVKYQLDDVLFELELASFKKIIIAYEPVWAIGTGQTATTEQAQEMHAFIRSALAEKFGEAAQQTSILYGGSCNPQNAPELFSCPDVDGGLIGGASLDAQNFLAVINSFQ